MSFFLHDFGRAAFGTLDFVMDGGSEGGHFFAVIGEAVKAGRIDPDAGRYITAIRAEFDLLPGKHRFHFPIPPHCFPAYVMHHIPSPLDEEIACFRYFETEGAGTLLDAERHELFPEGFSDDDAQFSSSSPSLDRIWEFCRYSIKATAAFGYFIDGDRERRPYEGDAYINQLGWFCASSAPEIPRRTIDDLLKYPTWPLEWHLLMPLIVRDYRNYADDTSLDDIIRQLPPLLHPELCSAEGLIDGNEEIKVIIDWPCSERDGYEFGDRDLVPNCYLYAALLAMYELTGNPRYQSNAEQLRRTLRRKFFRNGSWVDHAQSGHSSQHAKMFAMAFGVAEAEEITVLAGEEIRCSVYGAQFLLDALWQAGFDEQALALLDNRGLRSWNHMLDLGSTISLEAWDNSLKPNLDWNHAWGAAPANLIPRRLCGIRPVAPAFRKFIVDPHPSGLESFSLKHPTCRGSVTLEYEHGRFHVAFPQGTTAIFNGKEYTQPFSAELLQ